LRERDIFIEEAGHVPEEDVNQYDDIEYQINHRKWTICRTHKHTVIISVLCDLEYVIVVSQGHSRSKQKTRKC